MLDVGLRPIRVKALLKELGAEEGLPNTREAAEAFSRKTNSMFFISKNEILFARSEEEIVNLTKGRQLSFSFMISVRMIIGEIAPIIQKYEDKRIHNWKSDERVLEELCVRGGL
jgi:hypothetical protein